MPRERSQPTPDPIKKPGELAHGVQRQNAINKQRAQEQEKKKQEEQKQEEQKQEEQKQEEHVDQEQQPFSPADHVTTAEEGE